jgi:hypothetical protein
VDLQLTSPEGPLAPTASLFYRLAARSYAAH